MASPLTIIIFGASGDLTARKLVPALYRLFCKGRLPEETRVVGVARSRFSDDEFRKHLAEAGAFKKSTEHPCRDSDFAQRLFYVPGDAAKPGGMEALQKWLRQVEGPGGGR